MLKQETLPASTVLPRQRALHAKIRVHSWSWLAASLLLLALQLFFPARVWSTLFIILGGTWLLALLWTLLLARRLSIRREMRYGWAQVGDTLQERYTLYNDGRLPALWLEVQDHSDIPDYHTGQVTSVRGSEILGWRTEGICTRRGLFSLGPTSLRSGDPFGFFSAEIHHPDSAVLLVLPPVLPLPAIQIAAGRLAGEGQLLRRTALETTVSVETVREYVHGDPVRAIHWGTSARRGKLFVRQFDHIPSADWWIVLDLENHAQFGSGSRSTEEHGVILAASLADLGIHQGKKVGLVTHGQEFTWLPPQRSSIQLMDILRALAVVHPGEVPLMTLLTQAKHSIRRGSSLIVITPCVDPGWIAPLIQLVDNGVVPTALLLDPASFGSHDSIRGVGRVLADRSIAHTVISPELFDRPEAQPGKQGKWEWEVVAPGRVVAVRRPSRSAWRRLG